MSVRVTDLAGGLRLVTHHMEHVESASLGVWVDVGARFETASNNGVSHLLEHMAFKGTAQRSARQIAEEIEAVGGQLNAYTSREVTAYHATVLKEDVTLAVDILSDILQNPTFDEAELERERAVVLQEIGQTMDTPDDLVFDHFQEAAFPDQPMGRPVLGPPSVVGAMKRATLADYMAKHYTAPRMVVSAAGNLDHDDLAALVDKSFGNLTGGASGDGAAVAPEATRYGGGDRREARDLEQVHLILGFDGVGYLDDAYYAAQVMSVLMGGGMSSRLFQEIRETRGLAYSIYSFNASYRDGGLFAIYAGTGGGEIPELVEVLCQELGRAVGDINEGEVARARAQIRAGVLMSLESTASRAEHLARQMLILGRPLPIEELIERIQAVDKVAVAELLGRMLASKPTVAALGPIAKLDDYDRIATRLN